MNIKFFKSHKKFYISSFILGIIGILISFKFNIIAIVCGGIGEYLAIKVGSNNKILILLNIITIFIGLILFLYSFFYGFASGMI